MRMQDFVSSLGTGILVAAKTFGVSLTSVGSAMSLLTDEGMQAQQAATHLRMALSLMGAPSAAAAEQLKTIGLSSTALGNAMRSPGGLISAIGLLKSHLDASGLSATQAADLLSKAFGGGRSSTAILAMINQFGTLKQKQDQINDGIKNFGSDVQAQSQTAQAQFDLLRSKLEVVGVSIGDNLVGPVTKFAGFLGTTAIPDIEKFVGFLTSKNIKPFTEAIGGVLGLLAGLTALKAGGTKISKMLGLDGLLGGGKSGGLSQRPGT